ncbi:MAG: hypothetical protein ACXVJB_02505 [Mucilaginibacter sp.]
MKENKTTKRNSSGVVVSYQSEFMQNYVAESKIDFASGIRSVRVNDDKAVIFYIDKAGVLTMLLAEEGLGGGWASVPLSTTGYKATAFDVYFMEGTRELRICYSQEKNGWSELLVSEELIVNPDNIEILRVLQFRQVEIPDRHRLIDHITFDKRGVLYSSRLAGTDALYHYFKHGSSPEKYTLPENTEKVKQLDVGTVYGEFGVFILYDMPGSKRTMLFQSFPGEGETEISQDRIEVKANGRTVQIECFDLVKNADGNDIIYLGGDGIYKAQAPDSPKEIIAPKSFHCSRINVAVNGESESIWALRPQDLTLYYLTNTYYKGGDTNRAEQRWTAPLPMHRGVYDYSSIKGTQLSNQLFLIGGGKGSSGLIHLWQDSVSKTWHEDDVSVDNLDDVMLINSFTIDLNFINEKTDNIITDPITIQSRQNFAIYINNKKYQLLSALPIELPYADYYNIVYPADSIAVPEITILAPFLDEAIVIDPTASLKEKISTKIRTGADLANAKKQDGTPLISGTYDMATLNEAAQTIHNVSSKREKANGSEAASLAKGGDSQIIMANQQPFETGNALGDFLYSARKGFDAITNFTVNIVNDALQFVVEIGEKALKWMAKAASDIMSFLEKVWEKLKVAFKDIVDFLAFLFDWDDILETKEAIKLTVNKVIDLANPKLKTAQEFVVEKIKELKVYAEQFLGLADQQQMNQSFSSLAADSGSVTESKPDTRANWVGSKKELIFEGKSIESKGLDTKDLTNISKENDDPGLKDIIDAIVDFFKGKINIGQFIKKLAKILVDMAFDFIEKMANTLFEIAISTIEIIKEALNASINIPLISALYKKISGADLSILDFISLLTAIPMTIAYKIVHEVAPFKHFQKEEFALRIASSLS